jgi:hypothetical protein
MIARKGAGSYPENAPADDDAEKPAPESGVSGGETSGQTDTGLEGPLGANTILKDERNKLSDPVRIKRQLERYGNEMAEDAPASDSPENQE